MDSRRELTFEEAARGGWSCQMTVDKVLFPLLGVLHGISSDGVIDPEETAFLKKWREEHAPESTMSPRLARIFMKIDLALSDGVLTLKETLELIDDVSAELPEKTLFTNASIAIQLLLGVAQGVVADGVINTQELAYLANWLETVDFVAEYPICYLLPFVKRAVADWNMETEHALKEAIREVVTPTLDEPTTPICFNGSAFVLSGKFSYGLKSEVAQRIEELGGSVVTSVSKKTNYVVVGGQKSVLWKYDSYGSKIARAKELKDSGVPIEIIGEGDLLVALDKFYEIEH